MRSLIVLAVVGFAAQLVDGSLGMAYGVTSTTLMLAIGLSPVLASASVHLAEVGTTLASGVAHWRFGNVDWRVVWRVGVPGAIGAFAGASFLSRLSTEAAGPIMAVVLFALGIYVITRFTGAAYNADKARKPLRKRFLAPLGLVAGFVDATGGGGWGPIGTPTILATGRLEPRKVIGSIDTSEFLVAIAASGGFLLGLGTAGLDYGIVLALLGGGLLAAPLAAYLVRIVPPRMLGAAVGGIILLTNARTLMRSDALESVAGWSWAVYITIIGVWIWALTKAWRGHRAATVVARPAETHEVEQPAK